MPSFPSQFAFLLALVLSTAHSADSSTKTYRNASIGIEFQVPTTWKARNCSLSPSCIEFSNGLNVEVQNVNIYDAAFPSGLELRDGKWIKHGRSTEEPAERLVIFNAIAIYGSGDCYDTDENGAHFGTCTEALVTNGKRTAHIGGGIHLTEDDAFLVIRTFRFVSSQANSTVHRPLRGKSVQRR